MNDDVTAPTMLQEYRLHTPPFVEAQIASFRSMSVPDRLELLFYMLWHSNEALRMLHGRFAPDEAQITPFEKTTKQ